MLATLSDPEPVEDYGTKKATVMLDKHRTSLAHAMMNMAMADVKGAEARRTEAAASVEKHRADAVRWEAEAARLKREVERRVVDKRVRSGAIKEKESR